jgi:hypothetical protein
MSFPTRFERLAGGKTRVSTTGEYRFEEGSPILKLGEAFLTRYLGIAAELSFYTAKGQIELSAPVATR